MVQLRKYLVIISIVFLVVPLLATVSAQPIRNGILGTSTSGYTVTVPQISSVKQDEGFKVNIHVFNNTNGRIINYTDCEVHTYTSNGTELAEQQATLASNGIEYVTTLNANNFSIIGLYEFRVFCDDPSGGGFIDGNYYVTKTGFTFDTSQTLLYTILLCTSFLLFLISLYFSLAIPYKNKDRGDGMLNINDLKYLKLILVFVTYLLLMFTSWLAWKIGDFILLFDIGHGVFKAVFLILASFLTPMFFVLIILVWFNIVNDKHLRFKQKRGLV